MAQDESLNDLEWPLLTRYVTGDLSPAEAAVVERWFEADARHRVLLDELRDVWLATAGETTGWGTERTIVQLRRRAFGKERRAASTLSGAERTGARSFTFVRHRSWGLWAAGLAATVIGGGLFALHRVSQAGSATVTLGISTQTTDIVTRRAQRTDVRLPDGSRVVVGPASRFSYAPDFGHRDRTVVLDGDAYFEVLHDGAKPFRVRTARGVAEDLGTAFVVRARAARLQVVVAEGIVMLHPAGAGASRDSVVLVRGQLGRVLDNGRLDSVSTVNPDVYLAWTRGELMFEDTPLAEVAEELSRWYDVDVRVADSAGAARRFSGRLGRHTLDEAVQLIAAIADVSAQRAGRGWIFQGRTRS